MTNENKNLQELLAAISNNSNPNNASNPNVNASANPSTNNNASASTNQPASSNFAVQVPPRQPGIPVQPSAPLSMPNTLGASPAASPQNPFKSNFNELVNLLEAQGPRSTASVPSVANPHQLPTFVPPGGGGMMPTTVHRGHSSQPIAGVSKSIPNPSQKRTAQRRDLQNQPTTVAIPQPSTAAQTKNVLDLTPGLAQSLAKTAPTVGVLPAHAVHSQQQGRGRSPQVSAAPRTTPAPSRQPGSQSNRGLPQPSLQRVPPNAQQQQIVAANSARRAQNGRTITQEQVIVGHFCRHSIKLLSRIMQGNPQAAAKELQLKEHIKKVWAQWVKTQISRPQLLDSVATFVRNTCPEAERIDVIQEFKVWYEREFELQRQRSNPNSNVVNHDQPRRTAVGVNANPMTNASHVISAPVTSTPQIAPPAVAPSGRGVPVTVGVPPMAGGVPYGAGHGFSPATKAATGISGPAKGKLEPVSMSVKQKPEPAVVVPAAVAGKSVTGKAGAGRGATRGTGKAGSRGGAGGRGAGRGTNRKQVAGKSLSRPPPVPKPEATVVSAGMSMTGSIPGVTGVPGVAGVSGAPGTPLAKVPANPGIPPGSGLAAVSAGVNMPASTSSVVPGSGPMTNSISVQPPTASGPRPLPPTGLPNTSEAAAMPGTAGKGLLANKAPAASKAAKTIRKPVHRAPPAKPNKGSPSSSKAKAPASPSMESAGGSSTAGVTIVGEKRVLDISGATSSPGPPGKKPKASLSKTAKAPPPKKTSTTSPVAALQKGSKPPPARPISAKGRPAGKPAPPPPVSATPPKPSNVAGATPTSGTAAAPSAKRANRVDEELNVVTGVVDIEEEEDRLVMRVDDEVTVIEENVYSESMLLGGSRLRAKMQVMAKRFMLDDNIGSDVMELMSLAVEERLRYVVQGLRDAASCRIDEQKNDWIVEDDGVCVHDKMAQMREDEERSLAVAAEMRVKRQNERKDTESKKASGEITVGEKKDSATTGDAERKEKLAQEKKRRENSSQRDALSGLLEGRRKRATAAKPLAPLKPLSGGKGLAALPPLTKKSGSESIGSAGSKKRTLDGLQKLGPLKPLGRNSNTNSKKQSEKVVKEPLQLGDCICFFENEPSTQKSIFLYRWYTRFGVH